MNDGSLTTHLESYGKLTAHRTDKKQTFSEKVTAVNDILAADVK